MIQFIPHFQPIVDIPSGKIKGYEALARQKLDSGLVASCGPYFADPNIDKAFLREMDRTVRKKAIQAIKEMPEGTFLTLNISPEWIDQLELDENIPTLEMIREFDIDPRRIIIEITETEGDLDALQRLVNVYRSYGMRIAIDDFGAGYSELGRLIALEPDLIKLDMRFFKSAVEGGIAHDAVRAIGFMAERIGCDILCEGVETEQEFNFAVDCGATLIQGFLFYKPDEFFKEPESSRPLVKQKLAKFLESKVDDERKHIEYFNTIQKHAQLIKKHITDAEEIDIATLPRMPEGVVRFYICRRDGEQLSPNYEYYDDTWHEIGSCIGLNWSGRPYLHQMLALGDLVDRKEIATRPYRDRITRELFQTLGLVVDAERILLVDYLV